MAKNKQNNEIIDESVDDEPIEIKEEKKVEEPKKSLFSSKSEKGTRLS